MMLAYLIMMLLSPMKGKIYKSKSYKGQIFLLEGII